MTKQEILNRINSVIADEKGTSVTIESKLSDAELDSLGMLMMIVTIDSEFPILSMVDPLDSIDLQEITIRELVIKCKLSNINQSSVPNND